MSPRSSVSETQATAYADWFACLAEPTRLRMLHTVASCADAEISVGELASRVGISQPTCSHHLRRLADAGFLTVEKRGTATFVGIDTARSSSFPQTVEAVLGTLGVSRRRPRTPAGVRVRAMRDSDWTDVRRIYREGIGTGEATFTTKVASVRSLDRTWIPGQRWVAEVGGAVAGWAAIAPVSTRDCYAGVAESSVYVGADQRSRGVGKALLRMQVDEADAGGYWMLQASIFPENRASIALHRAYGFRVVGVREQIAQLDGQWRDTVLMERRTSRR